MDTTLIMGALFSLLIGLSLGLLGGGGSILTVPVLVYLLAVPPKSAIAVSLFAVGVTSGVAMLVHARGGRVSFRTGLLFGPASMAGAFAGGRVAHFIPDAILLLAFALLMLGASAAMMRKHPDEGDATPKNPQGPPRPLLLKMAFLGVATGFITGLVGAGGGFVVVPALALLAGLPVRVAIGTSLLVIMMSSIAAFAGHLGHATIDWTLTAVVTTAAALGSLIGGRLSARIPQKTLRRAFAWFVIAMGLAMLSRQIPEVAASAGLGRIPWYAVLPALAASVAIGFLILTRRRAILQILSNIPRKPQEEAP